MVWSRSVVVNAPAKDVWRLLIDTDQWSRWGPSVTGARVDGGTIIGPAARGAVRTPVGVWINFDITEWQKGKDELRWSWRVAGVPATSHWVRPISATSCRVGMDVPLWAPAYLVVIEVALRRIRSLAG